MSPVIMTSAGFLTGAVWSAVNFFFILKLISAFLVEKNAAKALLILLVKFPVLYFAGYLILRTGLFPVLSLMFGCLFGIAAAGAVNYVRSGEKPHGIS